MRKRLVCAALALSAVAAVLTVPCVPCVSVSNRKNLAERVLSRAALGGFVISYTHSVNKGRVHDFYGIDGGMLVLEKTAFVSYGAGIPEASETDGARFAVTDDGYVITNLNRRLERLVMAVGVIAEHTMTVGGKEVLLTTLFAPQPLSYTHIRAHE
ncbi:MAG: DUF1850 domain-containing protein, partial [Treponemataceae bacterium]|nr:DUF1850 domain-containing protein [Treponemataceae bacterium]